MPGILVAIIVFSILVLFHEFGHFIMAKAMGIGVTEFSLGMGPRIFSFGKGETKYSLKWIPFGGSCAMVGEDEDNPAPNAFNNKPAWARFLVVFAGPAFNIILAFLLSLFLVGFGGINTSMVHSVTPDSAAEKAGIEAYKDRVVAIDGHTIQMGRDFLLYTLSNSLDGKPVQVSLKNEKGEIREVTIDPKISGYRVGIHYSADESAALLEKITEDSPAMRAGLKAGDKVISVGGVSIGSGGELRQYLSEHPLDGSMISFQVEREGQILSIDLTPEPYESFDLGFQAFYVYEDWDGNLLHLIGAGFKEVRSWISYTFTTLKMLVSGKLGVNDLSGPVGIVVTIDNAVDSGMENGGVGIAALNVLVLMVLLSVNLGIMNLLPIPALDGGRILFLLYEMIFRKQVPQKAESVVHLIGFILLMILMVFVLFNDIRRLF